MRKTLLRQNTENTLKNTAVQPKMEENEAQLSDLAQELKSAWQEAANDLLQPRPEAIARLLGKVLH